MKAHDVLSVLFVVFVGGGSMPALAQNCPDPGTLTVLHCGDTQNGNNSNGSWDIASYGGCGDQQGLGPEQFWKLDLPGNRRVKITVTPTNPSALDAVLVVLPINCNLGQCVLVADGANADIAEGDLQIGSYIVVVDGFDSDSMGAYTIAVECQVCTDADGDGVSAFDAVNCPFGTDCCDAGTENSPGCSSSQGVAASINPKATETCGDGIDSDCDGEDCVKLCQSFGNISCDTLVAGDTTGKPARILEYGDCFHLHESNSEQSYTFTLNQRKQVSFTVTPDNWDPSLAILPMADGDCVPSQCIAGKDDGARGDVETVSATLDPGTYYVVVDGNLSHCGPFALKMDCPECKDQDSDGHSGYDAQKCPMGDDCCDTGLEQGVDGCTPENAASIHPGAVDVCEDDIDQDCQHGDQPCNCDEDNDSYNKLACGGTDCCDSGAENIPGCAAGTAGSIHPGAQETCGDDIDQDCTGRDLACACADADQDGATALSCGGTDCCDSGSENVPGCSVPTAAGIRPGTQEICGDGIDQDCSGMDLSCDCADLDGDGYKDTACGGNDCDDNAATVYPGAKEICDQKDNNCDDFTDEYNVCTQDSSSCSCALSGGSAFSAGLLLLLISGWMRLRRRGQ